MDLKSLKAKSEELLERAAPQTEEAKQVTELEDAIAKNLGGTGITKIQWATEDGSVTHELEWDKEGKVIRDGE